MHVIAPLKGKVALVQKPFAPTQLPFCVGGRNPGQEIPLDKKIPGTGNPRDKGLSINEITGNHVNFT